MIWLRKGVCLKQNPRTSAHNLKNWSIFLRDPGIVKDFSSLRVDFLSNCQTGLQITEAKLATTVSDFWNLIHAAFGRVSYTHLNGGST